MGLFVIIIFIVFIDRDKIPSVTSDIELYPIAQEGAILSGQISDDTDCDNLFPADGIMYLTTDKYVSSNAKYFLHENNW